MVPSYLIKINDVDLTPMLKMPSGYKVGRKKLWTDAGRNMNGDLVASFINNFAKITLGFRYLTQDEMNSLIEIFDEANLDVEYWDEKTQTYLTQNFYASDYDVSLYRRDSMLYDPMTLDIISWNAIND